ncbi:hypothetical protein [Chryseobacterium lathyri]|uniref:C1q domain-containing protein n=1 Tax=Chryseobacterium lathyri TaxID=395933 RepID=A0A511YFR8_9FLAO|nr:hypothetical protein [Chryseobacterium lathyri]GEN74042.1 hypothetical protein CLA01_41140 [Chryseobacterium lathyri]
MKTNLLQLSLFLLLACFFHAQVGINTVLPGSTLTVNGSIAGQYKISSTSATLGIGDFYMAFNGSTAGTFTLPAATVAAPAQGNILGRVYYIKNTGSAQLTVAASGAELIDNQTGSGVTSFKLNPAGYAMIISKGTVSGTTWELATFIDKTTATIAALGATDTVTYTGAAFTAFNNSIPQIIPFSVGDVIVNQGGSVTWNDAGDYWQILESGVYKIEGYSYFGSGGAPSGAFQWTGINLNITKNGTAIANIIGGNRGNFMDIIAQTANTPINVNCIVHLNAGDRVYLTMNWGAGDKPTTNAQITAPNSLIESRNFSLQQLSIP